MNTTADSAAKNQLRVLSYNIHKGFSLSNRFVLQKIKEAIHATQAEVVFLQEVIGEHKVHSKTILEWPMAPQLEFLADSLWPHFAYGKNAIYTEGHHGNAILSRQPLIAFENIDISNNRFERRGLLHGTVGSSQASVKPLHLVCVHLDLFEGGRAKQIERIVSRVREHVPEDCPLILAGDFNDWRENASASLIKELGVSEVFQTLFGAHARSFPAWFPFLRLDRIYTRGFAPVDAKCFSEPPWDQLSDHGALFAVLES